MIKILLVGLWSLTIISCGNNSGKKEADGSFIYKVPLNDRDLINDLIRQAIDSGNEKAYNEVASYYLMASQGEEFLYFAMKFANKYSSAEAYYHVYDILVTPRNGERLIDLDDRTKSFALYHLLRSYELGYHSSKFAVMEVFGDTLSIPRSSHYLLQFTMSDSTTGFDSAELFISSQS